MTVQAPAIATTSVEAPPQTEKPAPDEALSLDQRIQRIRGSMDPQSLLSYQGVRNEEPFRQFRQFRQFGQIPG